jgi:hypothetical protein
MKNKANAKPKKPQLKMRDLKPRKDAQGGVRKAGEKPLEAP